MRFTVHGTDPATGKQSDTVVLEICRFVGSHVAEAWELTGPSAW
jgi:hypothetical protein